MQSRSISRLDLDPIRTSSISKVVIGTKRDPNHSGSMICIWPSRTISPETFPGKRPSFTSEFSTRLSPERQNGVALHPKSFNRSARSLTLFIRAFSNTDFSRWRNYTRGGGLASDQPVHANEVCVAIGRDGTLYSDEGRHRLFIAKALGLEEIPVRVLVRHRMWQQIRDQTMLQGTPPNKYETHSDLP